ncbi:MAG: response regulator [Candidatus Kryptoniota bacterium]
MFKRVKILVIDEHEIILKSISKALSSSRETLYEVSTTNTAIEGLKLVRNNIYDLVFVDESLTGMSARETVRRIKNISPATRVIYMYGHTTGNDIIENSEGGDGILLKPFSTEEVKSTISRILML